MTSFKSHTIFLLIFGLAISGTYAQKLTKSAKQEFMVKAGTVIVLNSKYTNIEFELTDQDKVLVEAVMEIQGASKEELNDYFGKWDFKANRQNNTIHINSVLKSDLSSSMNKNGYYQGYFLDKDQHESIQSDIKNKKKKGHSLKEKNQDSNSNYNEQDYSFNNEAYIEKGDAYLNKWEQETGNNAAPRWKNKSKQERIALIEKIKANKSNSNSNKKIIPPVLVKENIKTKLKLKVKPEKTVLPEVNVRVFSEKRIAINKTLKIKIPKYAQLQIEVRHGKITFKSSITNLKANLSHVLLEAGTIDGSKTSIKAAYTNFEIETWKSGYLETNFSEFTLIKQVEDMKLISNTSTVAIDLVSKNFEAKGNFKLLDIEIASTIKEVLIDVEDSKKVWIKLPEIDYNLSYKGTDTKLIAPNKFALKTLSKNPKKQSITSFKNDKKTITINALASVMQIYDISWDDLKIKSLEGL